MKDRKTKKKEKAQKKLEKELVRRNEVTTLAQTLLDDWKNLKEVFRIPKKSQTPVSVLRH